MKGNEMTIATCPNCGIRETIYVRDGGELVCLACKEAA